MKKNKSQIKINKFILGTLLTVFFIYSFSLLRPWLPFDERLFFNEEAFPIPTKFDEIQEVINVFVSNYHVASQNTFFSNISTLRSNPLGASLVVMVSFFLKKNAFLYHILQLGIHLVNVFIVWLLFNEAVKLLKVNLQSIERNIIVSLFTLLWALHGASSEAILLVTNWDTILTYTFCFLFLLYEITNIQKGNFKTSFLRTITTTSLFCILMFLTEYGYTLPFIVFFITLAYSYKYFGTFAKSFSSSFKLSFSYFLGLFFYAFFTLSKNNSLSSALSSQLSALNFLIERNLWLVPQIFIHNLKLLFFPMTLSLYQTNLVHITDKLIDLYSILCASIYIIFLALPIILFIMFKNIRFITFLVYAFYFSLFPFLHIITPTYCLSADRYCYFPLFFILFFVFNILISTSQKINLKQLSIFLLCILLILSLRTVIRINEWNNPIALYKSAINTDKNPLYKGYKLAILGNYIGKLGKEDEMVTLLDEGLKELNKGLEIFESKTKLTKQQPVTLKEYGLDYDSLILKTAYEITVIKNDNYNLPPKETLLLYEPYINKYIDLDIPNPLTLYAEILVKNNEKEKAIEILNYGLKKFPYNFEILKTLSEYYLFHEKNLEKAFEVLQIAYKYYPNYTRIIELFLNYYQEKNDLQNQARFYYLLGLRTHSVDAYYKSTETYFNLNNLDQAKVSLKKLIYLSGENPLTLLLTSRYFDLSGKRHKLLETLEKAHALSKTQYNAQNPQITKSILISLINVYIHNGDVEAASKYLKELEETKNLNNEDYYKINQLKKIINISRG